jgi:hypothetical protein
MYVFHADPSTYLYSVFFLNETSVRVSKCKARIHNYVGFYLSSTSFAAGGFFFFYIL